MLIASFEKVHTYHPEYELHIYGEGSLEDELSEEIRKRGLENAIFLKGKTTKVLEKMSSARIFCLSSDYEGMSNSMIEAICMGLPVITTKVSGTEELIQNGINGYVTPIGDVEKFASCLNILMSNGDLVHKMSENNKLMAYKFSADKIVEQWKKLIYQIVKENN
jgi:glycosyltransferase involved in cell wall biosynthesis